MIRIATGLFVLSLISSAQTRTITDAEVMHVHKSALIIDTHNDVTSKTVEWHLGNVFRKLQVTNRSELGALHDAR